MAPIQTKFLRAQYGQGRKTGPLTQTLRQGVRIGLNDENAPALAGAVGTAVSADDLTAIATSLATSGTLDQAQSGLLARYELAVDARIDAALALADTAYTRWVRFWAIVVAIALALLASCLLADAGQHWFLRGLLVGIAAVPLAPVSHDLQKALTQAATAVRPKKQ